MKRKKELGLLLISFLALGVIGLFHSLRDKDLSGGVGANPLAPAYSRILTASDGRERSATTRNGAANDDSYYYSTASLQSNEKFIILSASDSKTQGFNEHHRN